MDPILYSVVDGGNNDLTRQAIIANNLANVNVPGFKEDLYQAQVQYLNNNNSAETNNSQTFIVELANGVNTAPGEIITTGKPLDVAISGSGYMAVQTNGGTEAYIRGGSLQISPSGLLTTASGYAVVGDGGPISIPPAQSIDIGSDGTISIIPLDGDLKTPAVLDRIKTVILNGDNITKTKEGLFQPLQGGVAEADSTVIVVGGALENSNVSAVSQMVSMLSANQDFDFQMKIMSIIDTDADKLAQVLQN